MDVRRLTATVCTVFISTGVSKAVKNRQKIIRIVIKCLPVLEGEGRMGIDEKEIREKYFIIYCVLFP